MKPEYCYLAVFLLLGAAIFLLLRLDLPIRASVMRSTERKKKIRSFKRPGKLTRTAQRLLKKRQSLLEESGIPTGIYWGLTAIGAVGGFLAGKAIYSSYLIATAVAVIGMIAPLLVLGFRQTKAGTVHMERLCSSMTMLSNSYISTEDFLQSVRENLDNLSFKAPFQDFLTYVTYMDSDVKHGLRRMEEQVSNPYFSQWIDTLVMAQDDRRLKYVCVSVVDSMHDVITAQQESDAAMFAVWRDYLLTLVLIFSVPLVFRFLMVEAYVTLTTSVVGQGLFLLLLLAVIYSVLRALKINTPLLR